MVMSHLKEKPITYTDWRPLHKNRTILLSGQPMDTTNEMCAALLEVTADHPGPIRFDTQFKIPGLGSNAFELPAWGF
jgi:hypothetical protein